MKIMMIQNFKIMMKWTFYVGIRCTLKEYIDGRYLSKELRRSSDPTTPSTNETPKLELKVFPAYLRYAILGENNTFSVIIEADLLE